MNRPELNEGLDSKIFLEYYYLKEELVDFCRKNALPTTGGKLELNKRIAHWLDTKEILNTPKPTKIKAVVKNINIDTIIEENFVCSEYHRAFFKNHIGASFSFNVAFQKWLKSNSGRTYSEAIEAYHNILLGKKKGKTVIDKQFEYNTYIRDFFNDNEGKSLEEAIKCWKYKKQLKGHNRYEKEDLQSLK